MKMKNESPFILLINSKVKKDKTPFTLFVTTVSLSSEFIHRSLDLLLRSFVYRFVFFM